MQYIDIHTHLNLDAFKEDREAVYGRMAAEDVACINVGTRRDTSEKALTLAREHQTGVYATVGLHPNEVTHEIFEYDTYKALGQYQEVVAIGECGLDYFRSEEEISNIQKEAFVAQIELANELHKPLMLHVRAGAYGDAYKEAYELIRAHAKVLGNVHFFAGSLDEAKRFWDIGYSTSFTGVITFTHDYDEVVKEAPKELIHAETDAPYVTPAPDRGKRNEPQNVIRVYERIAELRGIEREEMRMQLLKNAETLFSLS